MVLLNIFVANAIYPTILSNAPIPQRLPPRASELCEHHYVSYPQEHIPAEKQKRPVPQICSSPVAIYPDTWPSKPLARAAHNQIQALQLSSVLPWNDTSSPQGVNPRPRSSAAFPIQWTSHEYRPHEANLSQGKMNHSQSNVTHNPAACRDSCGSSPEADRGSNAFVESEVPACRIVQKRRDMPTAGEVFELRCYRHLRR